MRSSSFPDELSEVKQREQGCKNKEVTFLDSLIIQGSGQQALPRPLILKSVMEQIN